MLGVLGQFVVKVANLAEAEGRVARRHVVRLGTAWLTSLAALAAFIGGIGMLSAAIYVALVEVMPRAGAMALVGALLLGLATGLGAAARRAVDREDDGHA